MKRHAEALGGVAHARQAMQVRYDVSSVCGVWRVWASATLYCEKMTVCVCCPVCLVPHQSVHQFTEAQCVGRAKNPHASKVGKVMQLGFDRGN